MIDEVETGHSLRLVAGKSRHVPLHCTSAGKCLMAFADAMVPAQMPARTPRTITNPGLLRVQLDAVVDRGYAVDDDENHPGVRCISAPVFNRAGESIGCIGIDGPTVRMTDENLEKLAHHVVAEARHLTRRLRQSDPTT